MRQASRVRSLIDLIAALAMIATAAVVLWSKAHQSSSPPTPPPAPVPTTTRPPTPVSEVVPTEPQPLADAVVKGSASARIGIIEYADLECSACAAFMRRTYGQLMATFVDTGR